MGRPKHYVDGRVNMPVRMPHDLHERLTLAAAERDVSSNWLTCRAIEDFLDHLVPVNELVWTRRIGTPGEKIETRPEVAADDPR